MKSGSDIAKSKADARKRKLNKIRAKRRLRVTSIAGVVALVLLGAYAIYQSHLFDINEISVSGTVHLNRDEVIKMSGVRKGQSLLKISSGEISDRILKSPWVKSVKVNRRPFQTLALEVTERKPFAIISARNGFFYMDDEGRTIEKVGSLGTTSLPRIVDAVVDVRIGERISSEALSNAIACLKSLDPDLKSQVATLSVSSTDKLFIYTRDNVEILYGRAEEVEKKNQVIKAILAQKKGKLIFMDVRTVSNPIVKRLDTPVVQ